jgi:hypothetical protein
MFGQLQHNIQSMKASSKAMIALMFAFASLGFGQGWFNVDHGSLTLVSNDGVWRKFATEFPIVGGWMSPGSPVDAGNGPNGAIWVHRYHDMHTAESWGVYQTPISMEQYDDPYTITRTWSWGIYWVYGENKILEYGAFDYPYPEGFWDYSISYSAAVVPEPSVFQLVVLGLISAFGLKKGLQSIQAFRFATRWTPVGQPDAECSLSRISG